MSNGMLAQRLACEAADVFRAIAPVAGTDNTQSCTPSRPVPVIECHGRAAGPRGGPRSSHQQRSRRMT